MRMETIAETEIMSLLIFIIHNMETSLFLHKLKDKYQHSEHFILIPDWHGVFPSKVCRLDSWSDYLMDFRKHTGNTSNKLLVRFLGDAWCPDVVEEWVKRIEHDKNNDVDYIIDTYMFGVIENDRERKSSDFHVSFNYRG